MAETQEQNPEPQEQNSDGQEKPKEPECTEVKKMISMDEVKKHNSLDDLWVVIHGKVYDATGFVDDHPGGPEILKENAGTDATEEFEEVYHTDNARKLLADFFIGHLEGYDAEQDSKRKRYDDSVLGADSRILWVTLAIVLVGVAYAFNFF